MESWLPARAKKLPTSAVIYPTVEYFDGNGFQSHAETISYFLYLDATLGPERSLHALPARERPRQHGHREQHVDPDGHELLLQVLAHGLVRQHPAHPAGEPADLLEHGGRLGGLDPPGADANRRPLSRRAEEHRHHAHGLSAARGCSTRGCSSSPPAARARFRPGPSRRRSSTRPARIVVRRAMPNPLALVQVAFNASPEESRAAEGHLHLRRRTDRPGHHQLGRARQHARATAQATYTYNDYSFLTGNWVYGVVAVNCSPAYSTVSQSRRRHQSIVTAMNIPSASSEHSARGAPRIGADPRAHHDAVARGARDVGDLPLVERRAARRGTTIASATTGTRPKRRSRSASRACSAATRRSSCSTRAPRRSCSGGLAQGRQRRHDPARPGQSVRREHGRHRRDLRPVRHAARAGVRQRRHAHGAPARPLRGELLAVRDVHEHVSRGPGLRDRRVHPRPRAQQPGLELDPVRRVRRTTTRSRRPAPSAGTATYTVSAGLRRAGRSRCRPSRSSRRLPATRPTPNLQFTPVTAISGSAAAVADRGRRDREPVRPGPRPAIRCVGTRVSFKPVDVNNNGTLRPRRRDDDDLRPRRRDRHVVAASRLAARPTTTPSKSNIVMLNQCGLLMHFPAGNRGRRRTDVRRSAQRVLPRLTRARGLGAQAHHPRHHRGGRHGHHRGRHAGDGGKHRREQDGRRQPPEHRHDQQGHELRHRQLALLPAGQPHADARRAEHEQRVRDRQHHDRRGQRVGMGRAGRRLRGQPAVRRHGHHLHGRTRRAAPSSAAAWRLRPPERRRSPASVPRRVPRREARFVARLGRRGSSHHPHVRHPARPRRHIFGRSGCRTT